MNALARHRLPLLLCFLLPGLLYLVVVRLLPALFTVYLSFTHWNLQEGGAPRWVGVANYQALAQDSSFLWSLGRTLAFMVVATAIEVGLGLSIALLLNRPMLWRRTIRTLVLAPMVVTPVVVGMIWYILFHPSIGPVNWLFARAGIGPVGWLTDPLMAPVAVLITDIWHWTPFMVLLCLAGLQTVPHELTEAAQMDGASRWQTISRVVVPAIRDTLLVAAILRAMDAFELFAEPYAMTGGGPGDATDTLSLHIYKTAFLFFNMGYAGAMVVVSVATLVLLYGAYLRLSPREA
jgi:multiple sugar transport system permease protein